MNQYVVLENSKIATVSNCHNKFKFKILVQTNVNCGGFKLPQFTKN